MTIKKHLVTDEHHNPVAVLIDYQDWQEIEKILGANSISKSVNVKKYVGRLHLTEDPLVFQKRIRSEWS